MIGLGTVWRWSKPLAAPTAILILLPQVSSVSLSVYANFICVNALYIVQNPGNLEMLNCSLRLYGVLWLLSFYLWRDEHPSFPWAYTHILKSYVHTHNNIRSAWLDFDGLFWSKSSVHSAMPHGLVVACFWASWQRLLAHHLVLLESLRMNGSIL